MDAQTTLIAKAEATDTALNVVFGYSVVSKINGEDYFDSQGENVPLDVITKAVVDAEGQIPARVMHGNEDIGRPVFIMPIGGEGDLVSKSGKEGLYIGAKFPPEVIAKFASGEYTGFSIAGRGVVEEVEDA